MCVIIIFISSKACGCTNDKQNPNVMEVGAIMRNHCPVCPVVPSVNPVALRLTVKEIPYNNFRAVIFLCL